VNNNKANLTLILLFMLAVAGCTDQASTEKNEGQAVPPILKQEETKADEDLELIKNRLGAKYQGIRPLEWGYPRGVKVSLNTQGKVVALTLDACGGSKLGNGYDRDLIEYLSSEGIPATLFISGSWIEANLELVKELALNPLYTIENHGQKHRPLSVSGQKAYGIQGTGSIAEAVEEVEANARAIKEITGRKPRYYRSGTAYYDDVALEIVCELGYQTVNFNVIGDAGATFTKSQVAKVLAQSSPGSRIILHMIHPEGQTGEGVREGVQALKKRGYRFVKLADYDLLSD